jgi:hypothetical protein
MSPADPLQLLEAIKADIAIIDTARLALSPHEPVSVRILGPMRRSCIELLAVRKHLCTYRDLIERGITVS